MTIDPNNLGPMHDPERAEEAVAAHITHARTRLGCDCMIVVTKNDDGTFLITHEDACPAKRIARAWLN